MALTKIDWEQYRNENSDIPPNIFFSTKDDFERETIELGDKTGMIGAHKLLLAGASPVFRANFFGPMKMVGEVLVVKETTMEALATLVNFIYWPPGKTDFDLGHITCFEQLCNIIEISERYQVLDLKAVAMEALEKLEITSRTVITVALAAERFRAFEDVKDVLTKKSIEFIDQTMKSADDVFAFMIEAKLNVPENGFELFYDLLKERQTKRRRLNDANDWGKIIFSKPEKFTIPAPVQGDLAFPQRLTHITDSFKQWRFKLDFNPETYRTPSMLQPDNSNSFVFGFGKVDSKDPLLKLCFKETSTIIRSFKPWPEVAVIIPYQTAICGKWTNIEITNKEPEPGKCKLTVAIEGKEVLEEECVGSRDLYDVYVCALKQTMLDGFARNLSFVTNY